MKCPYSYARSMLCRVHNDCTMLSWLKEFADVQALPFGPDGSEQ